MTARARRPSVVDMLTINTPTRTTVVALVAFGALAAPAAAKKCRAAQQTPPAFVADAGFARMSGAEQLKALTEQTGGGHLAIVNGRRCIRYPDGSLVRI
jgi:succinate dehydrogenase/fumarate reductase flavoprotein subunit